MDGVFSPECCVSIFVILIGICIPLTYITESWYHDGRLTTERHTKLLIGVMSARENFEQRQAIRSSWIKDIGSNHVSDVVEYKFVVGSKSCDINIKNRKSPYTCEKLHYSEPKMLERGEFLFLLTSITKPGDLNVNPFIAFNTSIIVRYPIVVKKLGLHLSVRLIQTPITVQIYDANTEQSVLSAKFNTIDQGIIFHGSDLENSQYRFQPVNHVLLPKDFEGQLLVMCDEEIQIGHDAMDLATDDNSGGTVEFVPSDVRGFPIQSKLRTKFIVPNIIGTIHNKDTFDLLIKGADQLDSKHVESEEHVNEKLLEEIDIHDDLLFVDIVDVYRNLPRKLLLFHKWIYSDKHVQFVLKTDDDCYLNIVGIMNALNNLTSNENNFWWGYFRENWYVERTGKWAEKSYRSSEYPAFACGSGNIVSHDVSDWLAYNADELFLYQGEDTSMGIWLSAIGPNYLNNNKWLCDKGCHENVFTIPQLSVEEIKQYWKNKEACGNICGCE